MRHLLSEIIIKNFKSIQYETFELSAFTPLVGYNNAGKSNILDFCSGYLKKYNWKLLIFKLKHTDILFTLGHIKLVRIFSSINEEYYVCMQNINKYLNYN